MTTSWPKAWFRVVEPTAFGLDFSDHSIKLIALEERSKGLHLMSWGHASVPEGLVEKGEIRDEARVTAVLQAFLHDGVQGGRLPSRYVVLSLPEQHSFVRVLELPALGSAQLSEAVRWEAESNIPLPISEMELGWEEIASPAGREARAEVLVAATPKKIVASYLAVLKGAGLMPKILEVESMALSRSVVPGFESVEPVLIMDLGETDTSFVIFADAVVQFTSSVSISGADFTRAIAGELNISESEAEKLKASAGLDPGVEKGRVASVLKPLIDGLVAQIKAYLQFYREHAPPGHAHHTQINQVLMTGGGANMAGLAPYLSRRLSLSVELANPWVNVLPQPFKEVPAISYQESLAYATAIGLAIRGVQLSI